MLAAISHTHAQNNRVVTVATSCKGGTWTSQTSSMTHFRFGLAGLEFPLEPNKQVTEKLTQHKYYLLAFGDWIRQNNTTLYCTVCRDSIDFRLVNRMCGGKKKNPFLVHSKKRHFFVSALNNNLFLIEFNNLIINCPTPPPKQLTWELRMRTIINHTDQFQLMS